MINTCMKEGRGREPSGVQNKGCGWLPPDRQRLTSAAAHLLIFLMIEWWRVVHLLIVTHQERLSLTSSLPLSLVSNWSGLSLCCMIYDDCVSLERSWWRHISEERSGTWGGGQEAQSVTLRWGLCCLLSHRCNSNVCKRADVLTSTGVHVHTHSYTCKYAHMPWHIHAWAYIQKYTWIHIHTERYTNIFMDSWLKTKETLFWSFWWILMKESCQLSPPVCTVQKTWPNLSPFSQSSTESTLLKPTTIPKILWLS